MTMTLKPVFGPHHHSQVWGVERRGLSPARVALLLAAGCAVAVFCVAAPLAGNPTRRLFTLDNTTSLEDEFDAPSERVTELSPSNQWVALDTIDLEATPVVQMPGLEVRAAPPAP